MDPTAIILIGPMNAGKSTIATLLAEQLSLPHQPLDALRWDYYKEIGYDENKAKEIFEAEGFLALYRYWKPFEAYAVERVLADHHDCVIDFGAGHSVFEDEALFARVQKALEPYPNVILLLPSPDLDESVAVLKARFDQPAGEEQNEEGYQLNEHFVRHPSNHQLAKMVVYTNGKTPEATCEEILQKLRK